MKNFIDRLYSRPVIDFCLFSLAGAIILAVFSIVPRLKLGADIRSVTSYLYPSVYGSIAGGLLGIWSGRLRRSLHAQTSMQERYHDLFENASDLIQSVALDGRLLFVNRAWRETLGYSDSEIAALNIFDVISPDDHHHCRQRFESLIAGGIVNSAEVTFLRKDGCPMLLEGNVSLRFENDQPHSIRAIYRDISERKAAEDKIHQLAYYDKLTGLPNRTLLQDRLVHAIADTKRFDHHLGVVFIDLDHFKKVNDTLGHHIGDLLLQEVAQRLSSSFRENDTVARLGGDEFIIVLSGYRNSFNVPHIAQKILKTIGQPCAIEGHELVLSGSVGIAIYPQDGANAADLLRNADMAMYAAKSEKGDSFQFYSESMNRNAVEQLELENGLRHAIENEQLFICYQSQIDLETKKVVGVEALLRWNHPELGLILPDKFIAVAEETGLIISIGEWVLRRACREIVQLQTELGIELSLSVNLSGIQLEQPNLVEVILNALQESGLPSEQLELEITESVLVERTDQALNLLHKISSLGVRIAIDDFGTGYSSLNYLKNFPIDRLKIDRSFLVDILHEPDNAAIVETIIAMSRNMGLHVIAEGVETHDQAVFLSDRNCSQMQGFLFSKPVVPSQIKVSSEQANKLVE
ncbi:MAG: hypothetical protein B6I37_01985 [Desulfobacteraceae bacterium 4572_35.2]|nr:MAG: hypothetical protein B6I37_01985 [Desulfobacteraceae bacterium 4572_35.2]